MKSISAINFLAPLICLMVGLSAFGKPTENLKKYDGATTIFNKAGIDFKSVDKEIVDVCAMLSPISPADDGDLDVGSQKAKCRQDLYVQLSRFVKKD